MRIAFAVFFVLLLAAPIAVLAHGGATGIVKERMDAMEAVGTSMKTIAGMLRGAVPYNAEAVRAEAVKIAGHGGDRLTELFPDGSTDAPSEATAAIWENWEAFRDLAQRLADYANALADAADNENAGHMMGQGMAVRPGTMAGGGPTAEMLAAMPPQAAFGHLAQTCKDCHRDFRAER